jgi:surface antigen
MRCSTWPRRSMTAVAVAATILAASLAGGVSARATTVRPAPAQPAPGAGRLAGPPNRTVGHGRPDVAAAGTPRLALPPRAVTPAAASGTINCPGGCSVNTRSGPSTGYGATGSLANGTGVTIQCTAHGEWINGQYGHTNLWDNIGNGRYVSDALVYTGTNNPVAGDCGVSSASGVDPFAYPWPNVGAGNWVDDGHGYYAGECVSYSAWAVRSESHSHSPDFLGNADQWNSHGVPTGGARPGDVPMWDDDHSGAGGLGHVAFVSAVFNDGTIQVTEYNWYTAHVYDSRRIGAGEPSRYLHFY